MVGYSRRPTNFGPLQMSPGIHHRLESMFAAFFLFFHAFVVWPVLNYFVEPLIVKLGFATELQGAEDFNMGLAMYWGCHLGVFCTECYIVYRVNRWKSRNPAKCPKCASGMGISERPFSVVTIYQCTQCGEVVKFAKAVAHDGGE